MDFSEATRAYARSTCARSAPLVPRTVIANFHTDVSPRTALTSTGTNADHNHHCSLKLTAPRVPQFR